MTEVVMELLELFFVFLDFLGVIELRRPTPPPPAPPPPRDLIDIRLPGGRRAGERVSLLPGDITYRRLPRRVVNPCVLRDEKVH